MKSAISRAPITASTGLSDSAQIVRGGSNLTTVGAVPYVSASGILNQDASNLFWDATNHRLGIGTNAPGLTLSVVSADNSPYTASRLLSNSLAQNISLGWGGINSTSTFAVNAVTAVQAQLNGVAKVHIASSVGIGTSNTSPTGTLSVLDRTATTGATSLLVGSDGTNTSATTTQAVIKAGTAQSTTNLQEWQNNAGTVLASYGSPAANVNTLTLIEGSSQSSKPLVLFGASGGSGDIGLARADLVTLKVTDSSGALKNFSALNLYINGGGDGQFNSGGPRLRSDAAFGFSSTTNATAAADTSLSRIGAGVIGVGTGAAGSVAGTIQAATLQALGAGTASNPMVLGSGTWFTGGSATTTKPYLLIEPSGTTSTGWSTSGTGLGVNAANGFTGRLLDLQVAGSSVLSVTSTGTIASSGNLSASSIFAAAGGVFQFLGRSAIASSVDGNIRLLDSGFSTFGLLQFGGTSASFPALKRSTTGLIARLADDSADTWVKVKSIITGALTVATLPASPTAGERAFVTDSNAASFTAGIGAVVAAGGSTAVPVVYDGTNWRIG